MHRMPGSIHGCWDMNSSLCGAQQVHLNTKPSLLSLFSSLKAKGNLSLDCNMTLDGAVPLYSFHQNSQLATRTFCSQRNVLQPTVHSSCYVCWTVLFDKNLIELEMERWPSGSELTLLLQMTQVSFLASISCGPQLPFIPISVDMMPFSGLHRYLLTHAYIHTEI